MSHRTLLALLALCALGWWYSPLSPRVPAPPRAADGVTVACPLPPGVASLEAPLQTDVPASLAPFRLQAATLQPLAGFSIDARVLSRQDYTLGREAELSPTDLALGWGAMRQPAVIDQLDIAQSSRWYTYRWRDTPPLAPAVMAGSSANMHIIPGNRAVAVALARLRRGDRVRIDGWLVQAEAADGWRWRSSLTREDSGSGACEVVYACALQRLPTEGATAAARSGVR